MFEMRTDLNGRGSFRLVGGTGASKLSALRAQVGSLHTARFTRLSDVNGAPK